MASMGIPNPYLILVIFVLTCQCGCASIHANSKAPDRAILEETSLLTIEGKLKAFEEHRIQAIQGRYSMVNDQVYKEQAIANYFKQSKDPQALRLWMSSRSSSAAGNAFTFVLPVLGPVVGALAAFIYNLSSGLLNWQTLRWSWFTNDSGGGLQSRDWTSVDNNMLAGCGAGAAVGIGAGIVLRQIYLSKALLGRHAAAEIFNRNLAERLQIGVEMHPEGLKLKIRTEF
jgi:hypothetical protein